VSKLRLALTQSAPQALYLEATIDRLRALLRPTSAAAPLTLLQASIGNCIHMVPVAHVLYIEAADKYLRVLTAEQEYLLRTPLKELLPQLDPQCFWQIHRGTVVRAHAIASVLRDGAGKLQLSLRARPEKLAVSRLYAHLFKAM
jgi:DNA-binding LytR/AlgR family response regulator